jgi:hypothetical protein
MSTLLAVLGHISPGRLLDYVLLVQTTFASCYLISSFVVSSNAYAGFNAWFAGFIFLASIALSYVGIRRTVSRINYGMVLGSSSILLIFSLQTAIFWGQYSGCSSSSSETLIVTTSGTIGTECKNVSAMKAVCTFSVFLFIGYLSLIGTLLAYKDELLEGVGTPFDPTENDHTTPMGYHDGDLFYRGDGDDEYSTAPLATAT